jgi:hypothetical protein
MLQQLLQNELPPPCAHPHHWDSLSFPQRLFPTSVRHAPSSLLPRHPCLAHLTVHHERHPSGSNGELIPEPPPPSSPVASSTPRSRHPQRTRPPGAPPVAPPPPLRSDNRRGEQWRKIPTVVLLENSISVAFPWRIGTLARDAMWTTAKGAWSCGGGAPPLSPRLPHTTAACRKRATPPLPPRPTPPPRRSDRR